MEVAEFNLEVHGVPQLQRELQNDVKKINRELVIILNTAAAKHKTQLAKPDSPIRRNVRISAKGIKRSLLVRKTSSPKRPAALTIKRGRRMSLKEFGAKQMKNGIKYTIKPGKANKLKYAAGGDYYFVSPKMGNHAYKRRAGDKRKISKLHGPSVWGVYVHQDVFENFSDYEIQQELLKQFNRRMQFIRSGQHKKRTKAFML